MIIIWYDLGGKGITDKHSIPLVLLQMRRLICLLQILWGIGTWVLTNNYVFFAVNYVNGNVKCKIRQMYGADSFYQLFIYKFYILK